MANAEKEQQDDGQDFKISIANDVRHYHDMIETEDMILSVLC